MPGKKKTKVVKDTSEIYTGFSSVLVDDVLLLIDLAVLVGLVDIVHVVAFFVAADMSAADAAVVTGLRNQASSRAPFCNVGWCMGGP